MLLWPENKLPPVVRRNLEDLRRTGAALELDGSDRSYVFENFAWTEAWPHRFVLRDASGRRVEVIMDSERLWRLAASEEQFIGYEPEVDAAIVRPSP